MTLWLMALHCICRGRVWKTSEFDDVWATAFNIALISAAHAWAKVEAVREMARSLTANLESAVSLPGFSRIGSETNAYSQTP